MKKIFIFGLTASGKTTLANKLGKKLKIKCYSTDDMVYKKRWTEKWPEEKWIGNLNRVLKNKKWIIEGVHDGWTLDGIPGADLVIVVNPGKLQRFKMVFKKNIGFFDKLKLIYLIIKWSSNYYLKLKKDAKKFIVLKNDKDIERFLRTI